MEFNSAICTSVEQSKRLLELGLKRETADMCYRELVNREHHTYYSLQCATPRNIDIPAWSLHRLWELAGIKHIILDSEEEIAILYNGLISKIEQLIKERYFNKDYLEEK